MGIKDVFENLKIVSGKKKAARLATCEACEQFTKIRTCSLCGCLMDAKIQFKGSSCPGDRWPEDAQ